MSSRIKYLLVVSLISSCRPDVQENKVLSRRFRDEEKRYFIETVVDPKSDRVMKWEKSLLTYSIVGNFKSRDIAFIKKMVQNTGSIKSIPKLKYVEGNSDIKFNMPATSKEVLDQYPLERVNGLTVPHGTSFRGYFDKIEILVIPDASPLTTQIAIMHEFVHSLGLSGHPKRGNFNESSALGIRMFDNSYLGADTISTVLPQLDRAALEILYNKSVQVRMRKRELSDLLGMKR